MEAKVIYLFHPTLRYMGDLQISPYYSDYICGGRTTTGALYRILGETKPILFLLSPQELSKAVSDGAYGSVKQRA